MPWRQAVVFLCAAIPAVASAEMYTWIDSQGVAHFTDIKPQDQDHEPVELRQPSLIPMRENIATGERVSTINRQVNQRLQAGHADEPKSSDAQKAREARQKKIRCDGYRQRLERIQKQLRAGYTNDRGNHLRRQRREISQKLSRECLLG